MKVYIGTNANNTHRSNESVMLGKAGSDFLQQTEAVASTFQGQAGDDVLFGNAADDALFGGKGRDGLAGFDGDDYLSGGKGHDRLAGGIGDDLLIGGKGGDSFEFNLLGGDLSDQPIDPGFDRILDFKPGTDVIYVIGAVGASYDKATGIVTVTDIFGGHTDIARLQKHLKITAGDFDLVS